MLSGVVNPHADLMCVRVVAAAASHPVVCVYMTCCVYGSPSSVGVQLPQQRGCLPVCGSWVVLYSSRCAALLCGGRPDASRCAPWAPGAGFCNAALCQPVLMCSGRQRLKKGSVMCLRVTRCSSWCGYCCGCTACKHTACTLLRVLPTTHMCVICVCISHPTVGAEGCVV